MAAKRRNKLLQQPSEIMLYNSGLYVLFLNINIQISFFSQMGVYPRKPVTERAYNHDFMADICQCFQL